MPRAGLSTDRVAEVAAELADRDGFDALSLAAVAQAVGVRLPSLYNHVAGLEGLRRAVALRACEALHQVLADAVAGRAGADALRATARAYRAWGRAHPGLYAAAQRPPAPDDDAHQAAAARVVRVLAAMLRDGPAPGDEAVHAVRILRAALHGLLQLELTGGFGLPLDLDATFERMLDVLVRGLALAPAGGATPPAAPSPRPRPR